MNIVITIACWAAIIWSVWRLPMMKFLIVFASTILLISLTTPVKADELPRATMSILHYEQFRDTFMMAKCLEVGKADREDFAYAYSLLKTRDPMAVMAVQAGDDTLGKYLGPTLSNELVRVIRSFEIMDDKTLGIYCKATSIRAMTHR